MYQDLDEIIVAWPRKSSKCGCKNETKSSSSATFLLLLSESNGAATRKTICIMIGGQPLGGYYD